jgi:SAM-dependent methyltransferase
MESPACDLCGANEPCILYRGDAWLQDTPPEIRLVKCERCQLIYLNPRPEQDTIHRYYPDDYGAFHTAIEDEKYYVVRWMRRRKWQPRVKAVQRFSGRNSGQLLDVGASTGLFMNEMRRAGWQVSGVEINKSAAEYARSRFGLEVYEGTLPEAPLIENTFDVISFWDVLEHTYSPRRNLMRANKLLKPDGGVLIHIPNWESLDHRLFSKYWCGYDPPRHLYTFTQQTLDSLLRNVGFIPTIWSSFLPAYSYGSYAISLSRWISKSSPTFGNWLLRTLNRPGIWIITLPFFFLMDKIGLGGGIAVYARKH